MNKYKNYCHSPDFVIRNVGEYDKFRAILGNTFFLFNGELYEVRGHLSVKHKGVDHVSTGSVNEHTDNLDVSFQAGEFPLLGGGVSSGEESVGHGLYIKINTDNIRHIKPNTSSDFIHPNDMIQKNNTDVGRVGGLKPLNPSISSSSSSGSNTYEDIANSTAEERLGGVFSPYGDEYVGDVLDREKVLDQFFDLSDVEVMGVEADVRNEEFILAQHMFDVHVEIFSADSPESGWDLSRCRVFSPQFSVLLHQYNITFSNALKLNTSSPLYRTMGGYIYYFKKLLQYLNYNISVVNETRNNSFLYYNFYYNSSLSNNGERDYYVSEMKPFYNYYYGDLEKRAKEESEISLPHVFDLYSSKTFDSRANACALRNERICYSRLKGTSENVSVFVDDLSESSIVNSVASNKENLSYGVLFNLPIISCWLSSILRNYNLHSRFWTDYFRDVYNNSLDVGFNKRSILIYDSNLYDYNTRIICSDFWLEGVRRGKYGDLNFSDFDISFYDFGSGGDINTLSLKKNLSLDAKSIMAQGALAETRGLTSITVQDFFEGKKFYSSRMGYILEKYRKHTMGNKLIQKESYFVSHNDFSSLNFVDIQLRYGTDYEYKLDVVQVYDVLEYLYKKDYRDENIDEENGCIYFSLLSRPHIAVSRFPYYSQDVFVIDNPPIEPLVMLEPFRDQKGRLRFLFKESVGEYTEKYKILDDVDRKNYEKMKNYGLVDENGDVKFKNDDFIYINEVYMSEERPKSYADFRKIGEIKNCVVGDDGEEFCVSTNSFDVTLETNKFYYFYFRSVDVHGFRSNPTSIYVIVFADYGERSVLTYNIVKDEDMFSGKMYQFLSRSFKKYFVLKPKVNEDTVQNHEKRYKIRVLSKKTNRFVDMDIKFVYKNEGET